MTRAVLRHAKIEDVTNAKSRHSIPPALAALGSDLTAVVDERLQVHHTERRRVMDGSIMPTVVSGNTNATIVVIAEKGGGHDPAGRSREHADLGRGLGAFYAGVEFTRRIAGRATRIGAWQTHMAPQARDTETF
jgi:hypothetical protein